jgi:hypothetical protein
MRIRSNTLAWLALIFLTLVSVQAAGQSHAGAGRLLMTLSVATIAWSKGLTIIRCYLESRHAGVVIHRIVLVFSVLAPLVLTASGIKEFWAQG